MDYKKSISLVIAVLSFIPGAYITHDAIFPHLWRHVHMQQYSLLTPVNTLHWEQFLVWPYFENWIIVLVMFRANLSLRMLAE